MSRPTIVLLTDFGTADAYVGIMKGVIASICSEANVIDLCHDIEPQNVCQAAYVLQTSYRYFPAGTVHVAVVDPGVGSARAIVCARAGGHTFLAPDNGLLHPVLELEQAELVVEVTNRSFFLAEVSATFHGRDIFAPVAAHLASGVPIDKLGPRRESVAPLNVPKPKLDAHGRIQGHIIYVDRFGNLVSNLERNMLVERFGALDSVRIVIAGQTIDGVCRTYAEVSQGSLLALFGSTNRLEISINQGHAARALGVGTGTEIVVEPKPSR